MSSYDILPIAAKPAFTRQRTRRSPQRPASGYGVMMWVLAGFLTSALLYCAQTVLGGDAGLHPGVIVLGAMSWIAGRRAPEYLGAVLGGAGMFFVVLVVVGLGLL